MRWFYHLAEFIPTLQPKPITAFCVGCCRVQIPLPVRGNKPLTHWVTLHYDMIADSDHISPSTPSSC